MCINILIILKYKLLSYNITLYSVFIYVFYIYFKGNDFCVNSIIINYKFNVLYLIIFTVITFSLKYDVFEQIIPIILNIHVNKG